MTVKVWGLKSNKGNYIFIYYRLGIGPTKSFRWLLEVGTTVMNILPYFVNVVVIFTTIIFMILE